LWRDSAVQAWAPQVEVFQQNNELTVKADLPGLKRDEVSVDITDDEIPIQGERKQEHEESEKVCIGASEATAASIASFRYRMASNIRGIGDCHGR
jgi:HSP20 family molecular chaperone IbpA